MDNTVLTALIGLGGSALGSLFGVLASSKLTQYRLEERTELQEEKIRVANHRSSDLEDFDKGGK